MEAWGGGGIDFIAECGRFRHHGPAPAACDAGSAAGYSQRSGQRASGRHARRCASVHTAKESEWIGHKRKRLNAKRDDAATAARGIAHPLAAPPRARGRRRGTVAEAAAREGREEVGPDAACASRLCIRQVNGRESREGRGGVEGRASKDAKWKCIADRQRIHASSSTKPGSAGHISRGS